MDRKEISVPQQGMNRDTNIDRMQEGEFLFVMNGDINGGVLHNEPSNYLNVNFPEGYRVIGREKNNLLNVTYYILTNPLTLKSSIGYIEDKNTFHENNDQYQYCQDCDGLEILSPPKETLPETSENKYVELINDICLEQGKDLNLRTTHPVKTIVIKNEQAATTIYWEDDRNLPRYLIVSDVSYLYKIDIPCQDSQSTDCIQIKKLLQFPEYQPLSINPISQNVGGNLRMGTYEYYVAYCNLAGDEISEYSSGTNSIKIFDENNRELDTNQLDNTTNYSIKLEIEGLDTSFEYYRLVCIERGVLNSEQVGFEVGIFPTSQDTVLHTSSGRYYTSVERDLNISPKKSVELSDIFLRKPKIEKAKGEAIIAGRKYIHGVKRREEVNIQPIVNLFSSLLKWQTVVTTENLYKDGVLGSKYGGNMRDEVQPYSMRLLFKDGGKTNNFLFIARPAYEDELLEVDGETYLQNLKKGCKQTDRTKRWQFFNTARVENQCNTLQEGTEIVQQERRVCEIDAVYTIPTNSISIELEAEFDNLQDYIENNPDIVIPEITPYLQEEYPNSHCYPLFGSVLTSGELEVGKRYRIAILNTGDNFSNVGFQELNELFTATGNLPANWNNGTQVEETTCAEPSLDTYSVSIEKIEGENATKIEANFPDAYEEFPSSACNYYLTSSDGGYEHDVDFENLYMVKFYQSFISGGGRYVKGPVYKRSYNFTNEGCSSADSIQFIDTNPNVQRYNFRYTGALTRAELEIANKQSTPELDANQNGFSQYLQKGALWFKGQIQQRQKFILEITQTLNTDGYDEITSSAVNPQQKVRISLFNRCSDQVAFHSEIIPIRTRGIQYLIERFENSVSLNDGTTTQIIAINNPFPSDSFYVVIDPWVNSTFGLPEDNECEGCENGYDPNSESAQIPKWRTAPPDGCFAVVMRDIQYSRVEVSWDSIILKKTEEYVSNCSYVLPDNLDCEPVAYQQGEFSYWESTLTYPDNKDLFDSSELKITPSDLDIQPYTLRSKFEEYYVDDLDGEGNYVLKDTTDFRCKNIRHFKMPDNKVSPFIANFTLPKNSDSYIYPLGVHLDSGIVRAMLRVAVRNGLMTQDQSDNVYGYEILRGDNTYSRSVVANGLAFDMYKYQKNDKDYLYSNFPYNDLGDDQYHTENRGGDLIKHPYNGQGNNKYTFISPDLLYTRTQLPTEITVQGYLRGNSNSSFTELNEHSKWTILGRRARSTAQTLAIAESVLELAIAVGESTSRQWFTVGVSSGTSLGLVGVGIITAGYALNSFVNIGRYRYEWLKSFRDLGSMYNFAYYGYGLGKYSNILINNDVENYIKNISVSRYLPDGDFSLLDQKSGETYNINNYLREESVFFSLGDDFLTYPANYRQIDNSNIKNTSSKAISSRIGCNISEFSSDIASPYVTMKNYIPDQFGQVGSIRWLGTNKVFNIQENNKCEAVFGGNISISRFTYKRKIPFFRRTAFRVPDKTAYEYSTADNIGFPRFFCDYETDTEYNGLLIPMPDIDSDYNFDCFSSVNRFYIRPSKFYTAYYSVVDFLVESEMNLNYRYGGKQLNEKFYPLISDIEFWTQEQNLSIKEPNSLRYSNVFSLPNTYSNTNLLPYSYDKEFYKKLSQNNNEVIWSEIDATEYNNLYDPFLTYKPLNSYLFETKNGMLKSLKESVNNQAVARFTDGMQVFNTVDSIADKVLPQTKELGTGGIFATKPVSFIKNSLGFTGTQHFNVIETEFGDAHIDSERGQVIFINPQGNGIQDLTYSFEGQASNMQRWFKKNLPFKLKNFVPNADIDNPFMKLGFSGGYDNINKRMFLTKLDYIPVLRCNECLVKNGNFTSDLSGWDIQEGYIWQDGKAWFYDSNDIAPVISQNVLQIGKTYVVTFDMYINPICSEYEDLAWVRVKAGTTYSDYIYTRGASSQSIEITCTGNVNFGIQTRYDCIDSAEMPVDTVSLDNICVKEKDGTGKPCIPTKHCIEYTENGFVYNASDCDDIAPVMTCNEGYQYNPSSGLCEKIVTLLPCPLGFHYDNGVCKQDVSPEGCLLDMVFIIDRSVSLNADEMAEQKTFVKALIDNLSSQIMQDRIRVGIVSFASTSQQNIELSNNVLAIKNVIDAISPPSGQTNTASALCTAFPMFSSVTSRPDAIKRAIILTDGVQTNGLSSCMPAPTTIDTPLDIALLMKNSGIQITLVALGTSIERSAVLTAYGGAGVNTSENYPLVSVGGGLYGYSTYESSFENISLITNSILQEISCATYLQPDCGDCALNTITEKCECKVDQSPIIVPNLIPVDLDDTTYFKNVSWTAAFKFERKGWNSYFSFFPTYYNSHQDFFQTGYNSDNSKLYSHTLENTSFQVFNGALYPFIVETLVANKGQNKQFTVLSLNTETQRYQDNWNYSLWSSKGFNKLNIYNQTNNSGQLRLNRQKSASDIRNYPKNNSDNSQDILFVPKDERQIVNYFYNRVRNEDRNIPQWLWDENMINKSLNSRVVNFNNQRRLLERLRGDSFVVRLENDQESRFKINLKDTIQDIKYDS